MTATPSSNRLKLTPSNSPFLTSRRPRSPLRGRPVFESRLSLKRVVGTTCRSPTAFDAVGTTFAYTAGGAVVVVHVDADQYTQRFYRARPNVASLYAASQNGPSAPTTATTAPKANDSRNRVAAGYRDSHGAPDWADGSTPRTWTSRERIKAATCLSLSPDGKYLAVGETGYAPRVLIFSLQDTSSDIPLVSISEHAFGVNAVAWSGDSKYLASLGAANDGYLYVWKVDPRNGQTRLFQQNRCTSYVKDMVWLGNNLITLGIRHIKMWKIDENAGISPAKPKFGSDHPPLSPTSQKTLPGRNIILGGLLEATFSCAAVDGSRFIICTEAGDVCILDGDDKQTKVVCILNLEFSISTIQIRGNVAYVGGKGGDFTKLDVVRLMEGSKDCIIGTSQSSTGLVALGFMMNNSVTIDAKGSIDIWDLDYVPGQTAEPSSHIHIPGHGEPVAGICPMDRLNEMQAAFLTWSNSGMVTFWDLDGKIKASIGIPLEGLNAPDANPETPNQLTCVKISKSGRLLVTADRLGVLRVTDTATRECLLDTKAHSADCTSISLYEDEGKFLMACCGRDRTAQLFHRASSSGNIEHFQTIEFAARVVQVLISSDDKVFTCSWDRIMHIHDLVTKEGDPDAIAAIPSKVVSLKASPTSMTVSLDSRTVFVSMLDRSVCQYDILTGRPINCFKCMDESSIESAVLESISIEQGSPRDSDFLLAASNTDKSIRLYDSISGNFLDREWGHTEAINGVCFVEDGDENRRVVSVAADGTIMIWSLDVHERLKSREPSPSRDTTSGRPPLRRVLSKAELAEFQRPRENSTGQRSSPPPPLQIRTVRKRTSRLNLGSNTPNARTPSGTLQISPGASRVMDDTPSRRRGLDPTGSPPLSPRARLSRRPSLPALGHAARKKNSTPNLRGNSSLTTATEQACRTLRAYRKKLSSAEPINPDALSELDQELRFTAAALGDRAIRSRAMNETVLSGLLDQYSERLVTLLDEKLRLTSQPIERDTEVSSEGRRGSTDETSSTTSSR